MSDTILVQAETTESRPLTPDARRFTDQIVGYPITDIGGHVWLLAPTNDVWLREWRDRLYDQRALTRRYDKATIQAIACLLLNQSYDLAPDEAMAIVRRVEPRTLAAPIERVLFGDCGKDRERSYSDWIEISLLANGLELERIPPHRVADVLELLVSLGRAKPAREYVSSSIAADRRVRAMQTRAALQSLVKRPPNALKPASTDSA